MEPSFVERSDDLFAQPLRSPILDVLYFNEDHRGLLKSSSGTAENLTRCTLYVDPQRTVVAIELIEGGVERYRGNGDLDVPRLVARMFQQRTLPICGRFAVLGLANVERQTPGFRRQRLVAIVHSFGLIVDFSVEAFERVRVCLESHDRNPRQ